MASLNQDIIIFKDRFQVVQYTVDGVPDLVDFEAFWATSNAAGSAPLIPIKTLSNGISFDGVKVFVTFQPTDFLAPTDIEAGTYYYELLLKDTNQNPKQAAIGKLDLRAVTIESDYE